MPDTVNLASKDLVSLCTLGTKRGISPTSHGATVSRWGNLQNLADRLDPEALPMSINEVIHDLLRRSSSACAK